MNETVAFDSLFQVTVTLVDTSNFTVFVYNFSVLLCDFVFVNDCDFPDLFFHYFAQTIVI